MYSFTCVYSKVNTIETGGIYSHISECRTADSVNLKALKDTKGFWHEEPYLCPDPAIVGN